MPENLDPALPSWLTVSTDPPPADSKPLDGAGSRTRAALFDEWAARLRFPDYFGRNWDAFEDCLTDLVAERPRTLVVTDAAELLTDEPPGQLGTLLAVLGTVAGGTNAEAAGTNTKAAGTNAEAAGTDTAPGEPAVRVILHTDRAGGARLRRRLAAVLG